MAATLQAAFQRNDANSSNITVKAVGFKLVFSDASGRGTAKSFSFTPGNVSASTATVSNTVTGSKAVTSTSSLNGPAVTSPDFIKTVIQKFTEAKFEQVVGNQSTTLRAALYAQKQLPTLTNWYSVIGDTTLASVVQTALNLPSSFADVDVDRQVDMLKAKMNIADFKNPTKLNAFLDQYVASNIANGSDSSGSTTAVAPAVSLMASLTGTSVSSNTISGATLAALLFSGGTSSSS